jgi:hypothetical protein
MMSIETEARALLNNEAFVAALESARTQVITAAMMCDARDDDGRRRYLDAARIVDRVAGHLNALVQASKTGDGVDPADFYEERAKQRFALFRK